MPSPDYSFQEDCLKRIISRRGHVRRLVAAAPTGSGKTHILTGLFEEELKNGGKPIVYTHRRILREQLSRTLARFGIAHGIRASGVDPSLGEAAQVSSIHTERSRALKGSWDLHDSTLAIYDEAHSQKSETAQKIMEHHEKSGAFQVGFTATPVGLGKVYDELMNLITNSELRSRGVIVPCEVFSPSEIDMTGVADDGDDYVQVQVRDRFNTVKHSVIGDILKHYQILNPLQSPTVLFAPGVPESRWIAEYFTNAGIPSVHLEAKTPDDVRDQSFRDLESGVIKMVASYGIITEGWDLPVVSHAIFCRPTKSVVVYLQAVGRVLRAAPGKTHATLQDHAGAWWQPGLGSPNEDRHWLLDDTCRSIRSRERKKRESPFEEELEPVRCPKCSRPWRRLPEVCICGHTFKRSQRTIIQSDGTLVRKMGSVIKKKRLKRDGDFLRSGIYAAANSGMTVGQAFGIACQYKRSYYSRPEDRSIVVDTSQCDIYMPLRGDSDWLEKASNVYPWARRSG